MVRKGRFACRGRANAIGATGVYREGGRGEGGGRGEEWGRKEEDQEAFEQVRKDQSHTDLGSEAVSQL